MKETSLYKAGSLPDGKPYCRAWDGYGTGGGTSWDGEGNVAITIGGIKFETPFVDCPNDSEDVDSNDVDMDREEETETTSSSSSVARAQVAIVMAVLVGLGGAVF